MFFQSIRQFRNGECQWDGVKHYSIPFSTAAPRFTSSCTPFRAATVTAAVTEPVLPFLTFAWNFAYIGYQTVQA
jgi:hypothetical protein